MDKKTSRERKILMIPVAFALFVLALELFSDPPTKEDKAAHAAARKAEARKDLAEKNNDLKFGAIVAAQTYIEANLKSPSTADFPWTVDSHTVIGKSHVVKTYVDSQNSFGATVRSHWTVAVRPNGESWDLVAIEAK